MNTTVFASHCPFNWARPDATGRSHALRAEASRELYKDLFWVLAPGVLGVLTLAVMIFVMQ